jgi:putative membrane protein
MNDKNIFKIILGVSFLIVAIIGVLESKLLPPVAPESIPAFAYKLPLLNAIINGTCFVLLWLSLYFIKKKNIVLHKRINITAFLLSALFVVSYVLFHFFVPETKYPADAPMRGFYIFLLLSHILFSIVVLPLVLLSFYRGLKNDVVRHRKLVRFTFPLWAYVTLTGVIVYLMISPHYHFPA